MAKETRRQIIEQTRNEVARQYNNKITILEERLKSVNECLHQFMEAYKDERNRANELQEKVNQYEDWIRRLQEFMDMPEDAREKAIEQERAKYAVNEKLDAMLGTFSKYMNLF